MADLSCAMLKIDGDGEVELPCLGIFWFSHGLYHSFRDLDSFIELVQVYQKLMANADFQGKVGSCK